MPPKKRKADAKTKAKAPAKKVKPTKSDKVDDNEVAESENYDGIIRIEYCLSWRYQKRADKFFADLCDLLPERKLKPDILVGDRGSFEIYVRKKDQTLEEGVLVWSGQNKGPPLEKKFPKAANLLPAIEVALNLK